MEEQTEYKGFADIVEYHTHGSAGRGIEVLPASHFVPGSKRNKNPPNNVAAYKDHAIVLRRVWDQRKRALNLLRLDLEIQSPRLCEVFKEIVINSYETGGEWLGTAIKLKTPFRELFFYREEFAVLAEDETCEPELRRDAQELNKFIETNGLMSSLVDDYEAFIDDGMIPAEMLWTIYPPNGLVVVNADGIRECWICRDIIIHKSHSGYNWVLVGLRVGFNGHVPGLDRKFYHFPAYGQRLVRISDLPVVPIEHCEDWPDVKEQLLARSASLQKILGPKLDSFSSQSYNGPIWDSDFVHFNALNDSVMTAEQIDERVMVDYRSMRKRSPAQPPGFLEMLRLRRHQDKVQIREKPRGMLFPMVPGGPSPPPPMHAQPGVMPPPPQVFPPHSSQSRRRMPHRQGPGRRSNRARSPGWGSESEDSDWEITDWDAPQFDQGDNADIMDYKSFGKSHEIKEYENHEDDLTGLCELAAEVYNITEEEFQLLFPAIVPAFGLKTKEWRWLLSDRLQDVKWNTSAFESLQLEGGTKNLIQALVKGHKSKASFDDVVPGKGQGLVFLLHGKPGLGKTLTAESVADYLERPLYTIEGGELSTNAADLETDLNEIFDLTKRWDCVSLLDEADVLLCKRKSSEMDRNAVVAVFLRKIEYLQGVLFLTTNRRQDFDDAFKSRIHLTVSYPDLSEEAQSAIWKRLIATNKDINVDDLWVDAAFDALGKLGLNGRTIRNFLRTAVSFAHSRDEALGVRHVLEIIRTELKGEGFNVFSLTPEEHAKMAKTNEALGDLQRLVESS